MNSEKSFHENGAALQYAEYKRKKILFGLLLFFLLVVAAVCSLCIGSVGLSLGQILDGLLRRGDKMYEVIVWNIRMPRVASAIIAGIGLSLAGCVMQSLLRNPLAAPFTMGVSQGAAFGAAFSIIIIGSTSMFGTVTCAFIGSIVGIIAVLLLARIASLSVQAIVLAGVAMGTLFNAGTMLIQYFAEDVKVAAVIFWTFGDIGRAGKTEVIIMVAALLPIFLYIFHKRWELNILESGDESAKALGVHTESLRILGMLFASLITAVTVAFLGIIGFVGLIAPHIARRTIGGDYRYLIPISSIFGALLLLVADTISRTIMPPVVLPVGILTSFLGVPLFIYLVIKKRRVW